MRLAPAAATRCSGCKPQLRQPPASRWLPSRERAKAAAVRSMAGANACCAGALAIRGSSARTSPVGTIARPARSPQRHIGCLHATVVSQAIGDAILLPSELPLFREPSHSRSSDAQFRDWAMRHRHECSFGLSPQGACAWPVAGACAWKNWHVEFWSSSPPLLSSSICLRHSHCRSVADQARAALLAPAALRHEAQLALNGQQPLRALALAMLSLHRSAPPEVASLDPSALELQGACGLESTLRCTCRRMGYGRQTSRANAWCARMLGLLSQT